MTDAAVDTPPRQLRVHRWHLRRPTEAAPPPAPVWPEGATLLHTENPSVAYARFLYNAVGEDWLWADRRRKPDAAIAAAIAPPRCELWTLLWRGHPAGYFELDFEPETTPNLAYFGLLPGFTGRGLGPRLLAAAVLRAAERAPGPLTVDTCDLDHPSALGTYLAAGFAIDREETFLWPDPRLDGFIRRDAAPHVPLAREA